jgi:hypothetical protein
LAAEPTAAEAAAAATAAEAINNFFFRRSALDLLETKRERESEIGPREGGLLFGLLEHSRSAVAKAQSAKVKKKIGREAKVRHCEKKIFNVFFSQYVRDFLKRCARASIGSFF